ncbi:hypothetical protein HJFPF1_08282 [Paramyrothecium foliicola]|nr:hypothetical protein HJFPF1_08282 [Paramyrothecium foliicola]
MTDWQQCDNNRPKCGPCTSGGKECKFTTDPDETRFAALKRTHFVEALKSIDDNAAATVIHQLRQGVSIPEVARDVGTGSLLLQLHGHPTLVKQGNEVESSDSTSAVATPQEQAHIPPMGLTQHPSRVVASPYEELFDLLQTANKQAALEILRRIRQGHDIDSRLRQAKEANPVAQLLKSQRADANINNPYLGSRFYKAVCGDITSPQQMQLQANNRLSIVDQTLYITPFHAAKMVDPYLWSIKASKSTNVTNDDLLVLELLNSYFLHHHSRTQFCSSLLIKTLPATACHGSMSIPDRAQFWSPQNLAYQCLAEARRLWEVQEGKSSLTTIQAAIAVAMAHDLELFQSSSDKAMSKKTQRTSAFTTWCLLLGILCTVSTTAYRLCLLKHPNLLYPLSMKYNQSSYPVPMIKINEDTRTLLLGNLVKAQETLSLDEDNASTQGSTPEPH